MKSAAMYWWSGSWQETKTLHSCIWAYRYRSANSSQSDRCSSMHERPLHCSQGGPKSKPHLRYSLMTLTTVFVNKQETQWYFATFINKSIITYAIKLFIYCYSIKYSMIHEHKLERVFIVCCVKWPRFKIMLFYNLKFNNSLKYQFCVIHALQSNLTKTGYTETQFARFVTTPLYGLTFWPTPYVHWS